MSKYKEEAQRLVFNFTVFSYDVNGFKYITELEHEAAKRCALICVEQIILSHQQWDTEQDEWFDYYNEVKQEINKL